MTLLGSEIVTKNHDLILKICNCISNLYPNKTTEEIVNVISKEFNINNVKQINSNEIKFKINNCCNNYTDVNIEILLTNNNLEYKCYLANRFQYKESGGVSSCWKVSFVYKY